MALDDRQHVEAVAIMRRMCDAGVRSADWDAWDAAEQWLSENHPAPSVYMAALRDAASVSGSRGEEE